MNKELNMKIITIFSILNFIQSQKQYAIDQLNEMNNENNNNII